MLTPKSRAHSPFLSWIRRNLKQPVAGVVTATLALWNTQVQGVTAFWNVDAAGNWTAPANWVGGVVPNGVGDVANFNYNLTANRTVTLDAPITLGGLIVGDTLGASIFTFAGSSTNTLTFDAASGNAFIEKYNTTTDVWQAPLILNDSLDANIFAGTLDVNGPSNALVAISGSSDIIKNGTGTLRLNLDASNFTGDWVLNYGTLNVGGTNASSASNLGNGTGGIILNGAGVASQAIFSLNNNGVGSSGLITYTGNNDVILQGAATINVDRNYIGAANSGNTIVLDNLLMNGGILGVTGANSYSLRFNGTTTLVGQTNVFSPTSATLTLAGDIVDGAESRALIKEGSGRLVIASATNAYDGVTAVKDGFLQIANGAVLGAGKTFVNGGVLSLTSSAQTSSATIPGGLELVAQIGTSRAILPVIGNTGFVIDSSNPLAVTVPIYGMVLGIDGNFTSNIDISQVGGADSARVSVANTGGDRTYGGVLTPADSTIRLHSAANNFIINGVNSLGGGNPTDLVVGLAYTNPLLFAAVNITHGNGGTVSIRNNNASMNGTVTVNRGVTLNINGATVTSPLGTGAVTALGGTISTDNATAAQFANTDFRLYGGSTLLLDNRGVLAASTNRRLLPETDIRSVSSTLQFAADGGAASGVQAQTIDTYTYQGGNFITIGRDGATAGTRADLTIAGGLVRDGKGTIILGQGDAQAATLGTGSATSRILITPNPTVTNGMIGADIALLGTPNMQDRSLPMFVTYDATNGIQAAAFTHTSFASTNTASIVSLDGAAVTAGTQSVQALRMRSTASSHALTAGTITIGAAAGAGQGAGLYFAHTSNDTVTHTANFAFGSQEGLIYAATPGGTSGVVAVTGVLSGTNGITRFGDGILRITGTNTFTGGLNINSGETRLNAAAAAGALTGAANNINLWAGSLYLEAGSQRYNNNIVFHNDARFGNVNVGSTGFDDLIVQPRTGSSAPIVLDIRNQAGSNSTVAYGSLILDGPAQAYISHPLQINGGISGAAYLEKFGNERLFLAGDSSSYNAGITVHTGFVYSLNADSLAKPFGSGTIRINPGGTIRLAAPTNIDNGQVVMNSDSGGIAAIGMSYVGDPAALMVNPNSTASWKGTLGLSAVAFSTDIDQSTLWGGGSYLGALLGDTGIYTGTLTPDGGVFRLGTGQGTLRMAKPLTGVNNSVQVGLNMTGDVGRANQIVNNSGGAVQYDVPMSYGGDTVVNSNATLRLSAANATLALGAITLNGGALQADSVVGQLRGIAPMSIANTINLTADSSIQMQNNASDFRITGAVNLGNGSTGIVRQIFVGVDQPGAAANNAGTLYFDGGISDGVGGSGNHFIKAGAGTLMLTGLQTYTGTTTVSGGLLGIDGDADLANSSQIILANGGLAIFEKSFTTSRDISFNGGNGWLDVMAGLTLTQDASSTFDGANFIMKRGLGTVILNGNNAQVGLFMADGVLQVNNQAALGDPARTGGTEIQFGGDQTLGGANNSTRYTGGTLRINGNMSTNRGITFNNNGNTTYSGGIDVTAGNTFTVNGVITQGTENDFAFKTGAGTLISTGVNLGRQYAYTNGTFQFSNSSPWQNSTATASEVTNIEMLGGTIRAVNTLANIALTNQASTTNYIYGGGARLRMESGTGFSVEFAGDNLNRVNQGTLVIETSGDTVLGGAGATNAARLLTTNFNGVARASMLGNGIFSPHLLAADADGTANFATNDATTGIIPYAGTTVSVINGLTPAAIASITAPQTLTGANSVYALRTTADISGGLLTIPSVSSRNGGGILFNGSNTISSNLTFDPSNITAPTPLTSGATSANSVTVTVASTAGLVVGMGIVGPNIPAGAYITGIVSGTQFTLNLPATAGATGQTYTAYEGSLNSGEALLYVKGGEDATISGSVMAGSVTKFGSGTLTMSGGTTVSGDVSVQNGTLKLGGVGITSRMNSEININAGATLDLNGTSVAVETIGSNNRQVGGINVGGSITNSNVGTTATLAMESPVSSTYTGTLNGNLKLLKAGAGVLTIDGYRASTPDSGNNTYTGGTDIYGVGTTGGITLDNAVFGLGGANGTVPGDVNLYSGSLGLLYSNTTTAINNTHGQHFSNQVVKFGAESTLGLTVNVRGPGLINVNQGSVSATGQGNVMQIGALNMSNATLSLSGGNLYRLRVAGTTTIQGSQAAFQTNSDGPSGMLELAGQITGAGTLTKLGDGTMRAIVISNPTNNYAGGTNIVAGDVQVTATSGTPLGSGPVRVFSFGSLHLAGNGSVDGSKLQVLSGISAMGAVVLDNNFNPTVLTAANFGSIYQTMLQIGQPYWTQPLDMASIGDGRSFLSSGIGSDPVRYVAASLGAGVADAWNPGVGVYRVAGGATNFAFDGVNNVFTGNSYLQVGPQRNMVLGVTQNTGNAVFVRNSNDYTGGTQIAEATILISEVGGSPIGETPLGTGTVEVYGEYRIQSNLGSAWKADANGGLGGATNNIILRPSGLIRILDATNLIAGNQGRWGDAVPLDLNGGQFRYDGAGNYQSVETIGAVTARKGGIITVARNSTASSAQLNIADLTRADRGTLTLNYNNGFLGININTPDSYERLTVATGMTVGGNTANGTGVINGGMVAPWIVDRVTNSFVGYDPTVATTGFQPILGSLALGGGSTSNNSATVTVTSTTNLRVGMPVAGPNIPTGATITSILSATQFTMSANATATASSQVYTASPLTGAGEIAYNKVIVGALSAGGASGLVAGDIADLGNSAKTLADNPTVYALRSNQNLSPTASNNTVTLTSGGLILTGGTINPTSAITAGVVSNMTLNFGTAGAGEAFIYVGAATSTIQAQIVAAQGLTKFGLNQLNIHSINPGIGGAVVVNEGTLFARIPVAGGGSGGAVGTVFNGQDIILNGGGLALATNLANAAGTASEIASNVVVSGSLGSSVFVRGDASLSSNGQAQYAKINNLTIANDSNAPAMDGNGVISLALQSGIWVGGTTTLSPQARLNVSQSGMHQSTLAGPVVGVGGVLEKYGNGAITLLNANNTYSGGTIIHGTTAATTVSTVASGVRGAGTPFGTGSITVNPGGMLRVADNANIASNAVTLRSDGLGLAGIAIAHNGSLPTIITTGTPTAGQVKVETTGVFAGVIGLDYGYYSQGLDMASIPGGDWWLGNSMQAEAYYFNPSLGTAASGKYLLGGGGSNSGVNFGSVLVNAGRTTVFENIFSGGTTGQVQIEIGAQTGDFAWNAPSFVNGNSGFIVMATRNTGLVGDVRVNTNSTLSIGNSFALGNGRLIVNGGNIRSDFGNVNFAGGMVTLNNDVLLQGDYNATSGGDLVLRGGVALSDVLTAGATRNFNINLGNLAIRGVLGGAAGSNVIKLGATSLILTGANTYQGYTQVTAGTLYFAGDVMPNQPGPLGMSDSPVIMAGGTLRAAGRLELARDVIVNGTGTLDTAVHDQVVVSGGVSIANTVALTVGSAGIDNAGFRGGLLRFTGAISGAGALTIGTTAVAPAVGGTVHLAGTTNGYGINTYAGGTTLQTARVQLSGATYYTGPASNPLIISGPLGTGAITIAGGEGNRGSIIEAVGGPVTIVNPFVAISTTANTTLSFGGHEALTFTRDLNLNSDNTLRSRTFAVQNVYEPVTFNGNLSATGTAGVSLIKTGPGKLILGGTNSFATSSSTGIQISSGILQVSADGALGAAGAVRLSGGYLAAAEGFSTPRQFILTAASGVDVAPGKTLTLTAATSGASGLTKVGPGTLALNNSANTQGSLTIGGAQQLYSGVGFSGIGGGVVSTTATSGTPFAAGGSATVTINGGALALIGGATAQALSVPTLNYGANAAIALFQNATSSQLTIATAFNRTGAFNSVNYGTLTVVPSALANLGTTEKILVTTGAPANTATGGGDILSVPSIFARLQAANSDANFTRYNAAGGGIMVHNVTTVATLGASAAANVADISSADVAGAGNIDVQAVRTTANIAPTDGTTVVRIARGGLIINGSSGATISAPLVFGTGTGSSLTEAIVYAREGQSSVSALNGGVTARDFTKTGPGLLEIGGTSNFLNSNAVRLPVVSVQDGTLRFANTAAFFQNQLRGTALTDYLGGFVLNVNETGVFDLNQLNVPVASLAGNGTVTSSKPGTATLTVKNGFGVDTTFSGQISDGAGTVSLVKTQNGILTLNGHGSHTGGTDVQAGRVTNATGSVTVLGRLEAQTVTALGNGPITVSGGWLRLNGANLLGSSPALTEVTNAIDYLLWGTNGGYNITIANTAYTNGIELPANVSSILTATTLNAGINSLTIDAPMLTMTEGLIQVLGTTTFAQDNTVLRLAGGRLFLAGKLDAAGKTIIKTGANDLVLTNSAPGTGQNQVGLWKLYGGIVEARTTNGSSNPLGVNPTVELNTGSTANGLRLLTDGDGTGLGERIMTYADTTVRFGSLLELTSDQFVASGSSRLSSDRAFVANNSWKTVQINNLEVGGVLGSPLVYFVLGNNDSLWVNGTTTFTRELNLQIDGGQGLTLNGLISGNGTVNRRANGGTLYINADNTNGYNGGTFIVGGGRNYFGSIEGGQVTLSNTAKLGQGHVFLGPIAMLQINDAGNLQTDQNIYVSGNLSWFANLSLAADLTLDQVRLRALGLGGVQNTPTDYFLSASNPSTGVLSLGTVYTHALDMRAIGDGMWYLGSSTNGIGANGVYNASTLTPGLGNTYRLGAGGNTLFVGTNGNANVLTDVDASTPSSLTVGSPLTVQSMGVGTWGAGVLVLMGDQNYTGSTLINTGSTLDFRGTMTTADFKVYGTLNVAGETGSFINPVSGDNIPVTLRPGSLLRFDNTSAGVLPASATEGRWKDNSPLSLANSVLRLQGNAAVEVTETVGPITVGAGADRIEIVRGAAGRGTELRTPSLTRVNSGTLQLIHNGSTLGSDERLVLTGAAPTITNGMVAPWIFSATDVQFATYNSTNGFVLAGFDHVFSTAATLTTSVNLPTTRAFFSAVPTLNGADYSVYGLRIDADVNLTSASAATNTTNRLVLGSGGLLVNGARTIQAGIWAGTAGDQELIIYNNNTLNVGILANNTTSGRIRASSITKTGGGTFNINSDQPDFSGDIRIQQGAVQVNYTGTATANLVSTLTGNGSTLPTGGGNIVFQGNNTSLILRIGNDSFTGFTFALNNNIVLGDYLSVATLNNDRNGGGISGKTMVFNNLTFGQNEGDVGQVFRVLGANGFRTQINGTTTLVGRSSFAIDNNYNGTAADMLLMGKVTGSGTLIKGPSDSRTRNLLMQNVNSLNDYTGGTILLGGTLQVQARATNVLQNVATNITAGGLGSGNTITLMEGTLDLRVDGNEFGAAVPDTEIEFIRYTSGSGNGQDVIVNGSAVINADRNAYTGTYTRTGNVVTADLPGGHGFVVGQSITIPTGGVPTAGTFVITAVSGNTVTYTDTNSGTASGYFTMTSNVSTNKMITFNNLTIGAQTLTASGGNSYGQAFEGTTMLLGSLTLNNGSEVVLGGGAGSAGLTNTINTDGGQIIFNKIGTGTLWIHSANTNFNSPVYINAGSLDFGNRAVANNSASFGTGPIYINPGAIIRLRNTANINTALGQKVSLIGTSYAMSLMRILQASPTQAAIGALLQQRTTTSNEVVILGFENTISAEDWDQSSLGDGRVYFGAISGDRTYTGSGTNGFLVPGLASLPNNVVGGNSTNRAYRLGGGESGRAIFINLNGTGNLNDVGGVTDLLVGSLAAFGPSGNLGVGQVRIADQNTYTGQTTISRGSVLRTEVASTSVDAGPFGKPGATPIHVYGTLQAEGTNGSFRSSDGSGNAYTGIHLHPGGSLVFLNNTAANPGAGNRWDDSTGIQLDGARLVLDAANNIDKSAETVGDITFDRGARIATTNEGTSEVLLTVNSITRANASAGAGTGRGTMVFVPSNSANLGLPDSTNNAEQVKFSNAPVVSAVSAVANTLPGYYIDGTGGRFVAYGANGVTPIADGSMVAFTAGMTAGSALVNMTGNLTLPDFNPVIFGLRIAGNITLNSPTGANNDATITFGGSGSDIGAIINTTTTGTINPNVKFGLNGTNEALFYLGGTLTLNGNITAGSITKFGTGQLNIANDQSDAARGIGQGYSGGWFINEGSVNLTNFGAAGNAVASNAIVLNGNQAGTPTLFLRANPADSLINYSYSSGSIITVDNGIIDWEPGADDRVHTIADLEIQQSGGIGQGPANANNDAMLRIILARNRSILSAGSLTLTNNSILAVDPNVGTSNFQAYANNGAYLTTGISTGMSVSQLIGTARLTKWGEGYLYIRGASPSFSGTVVIDQGAIHVTNNNSLGSGDVTVNRYGTLDIGVANFVPTNSSLTYNEGSIERWSVNGARSGILNLGKATLQIAANQPTTNVAVTLNGGGVEAWLRSDDLISAQSTGGVLRVLNPNISFTLAGDSYVGARYYLGANGLDLGKQTHDNRPLTEYLASGAILEIKGTIDGPGKLTKAGYDTVILSGGNSYEGGTDVEGGRLLLGRDNALPTNTRLTTMANAVLDLNGQNQTVGVLTNPGTPATGVNATSGYITNSATTNKTLTVGNTVTTDFAYSGVIQHNVSLTKTGTATFTLNNVNTYLGKTTVTEGSLVLAVNATIDDSSWIEVSSSARMDFLSKLNGYTYDGVFTGGGVDVAGTTFGSVINAGRIDGSLTIGDHTGLVSSIGTLRPGGSSVATDISTAGNQIGHLYFSGDLTLNGGLTGASPVTPVTRLTLQLNGATATLTGLGLAPGDSDVLGFLAGLPSGTQEQQDTLNGLAGNIGNHDYINVAGNLQLNGSGRIAVTNYGSYTPAYGDLFNLMDWSRLFEGDFNVTSDLSLPTLPSGQFWDTSLFFSHGVVVVVPEPSRALFLMLGLCALFIRRRRR